MSQTIDCDADPILPEGWKFMQEKAGRLEFDPSKTKLHLEPCQERGKIVGGRLYGYLKGKPVMNVKVLEWLLAHPSAIPEQWRFHPDIYFWGTILHSPEDGRTYVCYMHWNYSRWCPRIHPLDRFFNHNCPALLRVG